MKKLLIASALLLTLAGCAWVKDLGVDYQTCYADKACHDGMLSKARMAGEIGQTIGSASGVPVAGNVAGSVCSGLALVLSGIFGGMALRKKDAPK